MPSIKQNPAGLPVPDFRNFGVMLRVLLGVNLMAFAVALGQSGGLSDAVQRFAEQAAWVQPVLLFDLCLLALCWYKQGDVPWELFKAIIPIWFELQLMLAAAMFFCLVRRICG